MQAAAAARSGLLARVRSWFGRGAPRDPEVRRRLDAWLALQEDGEAGLDARIVVVDVESSGLDVRSDSLIAIGAVAVRGGRMLAGEAFHVVLRQPKASTTQNILIHGIGAGAQAGGNEPASALLDFLEFAGKAPLAGYHTAFDRAMIDRAARQHLGRPTRHAWLDLAWMCPALEPERGRACRSLDQWTDAHGITNMRRHDALADAMATAQLLQVMLARARGAGMRDVAALLEAARSAEWLSRQGR